MVEQWFDLYADDIYTFLVYVVKDRELAKDLSQETFVRAIRGIHGFRGDAEPKTWLLKIARNAAINHIRRWRREVAVDDSKFERLVSQFESPESAAERRDTRERLLAVLYKIKPAFREVIIYREIIGLSNEETARVLGWTSNRVRVTLHRALKAARKKLIEGGWERGLAGYQ